jgi:Spy/CpxP family protein refolding chaperone
MYEMNEAQLRELIAKLRSRNPNSAEARQERTVLEDAEQLLREKVLKRTPSGSDDIIFDELK